jgi:hypothetical protein
VVLRFFGFGVFASFRLATMRELGRFRPIAASMEDNRMATISCLVLLLR